MYMNDNPFLISNSLLFVAPWNFINTTEKIKNNFKDSKYLRTVLRWLIISVVATSNDTYGKGARLIIYEWYDMIYDMINLFNFDIKTIVYIVMKYD